MIMKRLLTVLVLLSMVLVANAIPAKRGVWTEITLADGNTVRVEMCGDEYFHYWKAVDGTVYQKVEGTEYYALADFTTMSNDVASAQQSDNMRRAARLPKNNAKRATAYTGTKRGLVILMEFPNQTFKTEHNQAFYNNLCNKVGFTYNEGMGHNGSVHDYFSAQSNGLFDLEFDVAGPYMANNNYDYYGKNTPYKDYNVSALVREAVTAAKNDGVNFTSYDWDGDNYVDQVFILYAGDNEAYAGSDPNTIWPHESSIYRMSVGNGKYVQTYACASEMTSTLPNGIGTFCHEFTHCLGIMDMYDSDYEGSGGDAYGMGHWDTMAGGCDNNYGYTPAGYTSYEKWQCGWLAPTVLTGIQDITEMKALSESGEAYIIYNQGNSNEYYLLENRQKTGWDASLPAAGLLILHVDYDYSAWHSNDININPEHQRLTIFHADNTNGDYDEATDPYPYRKVNSLTNESTPAATVFNKNSDGSNYMNYPICQIQMTDGLISFHAGSIIEDDDPNGPTVDTTDALFYESFDKCNGEGCNDNLWGLSGLGGGSFIPDNEGWFYNTGAAYGADRCARFGSNKYKGTVRTPAITINGSATLYFKAAAFSGDGTALELTVDNGAQLSESSFQMSNSAWTAYETTITGSGDIKVTFWPANRLYLDEVVVKGSTETGIHSLDNSTNLQVDKSSPRYNLAGQRVSDSYKGIVIVNGKKTVRK